MSNPFTPWLPTYGTGVHPVYPWWRFVPEHTADTGGLAVYVRRPGLWHRMDRITVQAAEDEPGTLLRAVDDVRPLPAPPPMCGQVWAARDADSVMQEWATAMVIEVRPVGFLTPIGVEPVVASAWDILMGGQRGHVRADDAQEGGPTWPPPGAVLVSGPHAPWAPAGWKP